MDSGSVTRGFARHIVSWYAGVHVDQVAEAEGVQPAVIRAARRRHGRGGDYGLMARQTMLGKPAHHQLSFAELECAMRANRNAA